MSAASTSVRLGNPSGASTTDVNRAMVELHRLKSVYVPLAGGQEAVHIPLLSTDVEQDITDILRLEQIKLELWLTLAIEYHKRGLPKHAMHVLTEGTQQDVEDFFADEKYKAERVAMLNAIAAIHTQAALAAREIPNNSKNVDAASSRATQYWNRSSMIDTECPLTWVGKGLLQFVKGKFDDGEQFFKNAISFSVEQKKDIIPALLGRGIICYHKNPPQYKEAIAWFKRALECNPELPAANRLGLAMCYVKLKDFDTARLVYERILKMDETNLVALMGLATLEQNAGRVQLAMEKVAKAYEIDPNHPFVQTTLSNHLFYTGAFEAVKRICTSVQAGVENRELKAEAGFQIARCHHVEKNYGKALSKYAEANVLAPNHTLLNYRYAQVLFATKDHKTAIACMEKVYAENKNDFDVLQLLGNLYAKTGDDEKARKLLKQASELQPTNVDLLIELFNVSQRNDLPTAFNAMIAVTKLLSSQGKPVPPELWNNLGVVAKALNKPNNARTAWLNALAVIDHDEKATRKSSTANGASSATAAAAAPSATGGDVDMTDSKSASAATATATAGSEGSSIVSIARSASSAARTVVTPRNVTIQYNLATLYEQTGDKAAATALYNAILAQFPEYTDARLRLGAMELQVGRTSEAIKIFTEATQKSPNSANAYSYLGRAYLEDGDAKQAMKQFNHILKTLDRSDVYSKLMLGQIHTLMSTEKAKAKNQLRLLDKAGKYYRSVLAKDARNVYAANGLGVVLSGRGRWADSKAVFSEIKDVAPEVTDVWLNLGHVYTHQSLHLNAVKLYEHVLKKYASHTASSQSVSSEETVNVLLYLANAYFQVGGQMPNAKKCLLKAIRLAPDDLMLWYNLGLAQEDFAVSILQMTMTNRTYKEVEHAVNELKSAQQIFERLEKTPDAAQLGVEPDKAKVHARFCATTLEVALPHLEHAKKREADNEAMRILSESKAAEIENRAKAAIEEKVAKEREEKERLQELAKRKKTELQAQLSKWETERASDDMVDQADVVGSVGEDDGKDGISAAAAAAGDDASGSGGGKKKKKSSKRKKGDGDEFEEGGGDEDAEGGKKKKKKKDKSNTAAAGGGGGDDTKPATDAKNDAPATEGGAGGDAAATAAAAGGGAPAPSPTAVVDDSATAGKKRRLKRAVGDDSDDDGDDKPTDDDAGGSGTQPATSQTLDDAGATEAELFGEESPPQNAAAEPAGEVMPLKLEPTTESAPATAAAAAAAVVATIRRAKKTIAEDDAAMDTNE